MGGPDEVFGSNSVCEVLWGEKGHADLSEQLREAVGTLVQVAFGP